MAGTIDKINCQVSVKGQHSPIVEMTGRSRGPKIRVQPRMVSGYDNIDGSAGEVSISEVTTTMITIRLSRNGNKRYIYFKANPQWTIGEFKKEIKSEVDIPVDNIVLRLPSTGRELKKKDNHVTLEDVGVGDNCVVEFLAGGLRGG